MITFKSNLLIGVIITVFVHTCQQMTVSVCEVLQVPSVVLTITRSLTVRWHGNCLHRVSRHGDQFPVEGSTLISLILIMLSSSSWYCSDATTQSITLASRAQGWFSFASWISIIVLNGVSKNEGDWGSAQTRQVHEPQVIDHRWTMCLHLGSRVTSFDWISLPRSICK